MASLEAWYLSEVQKIMADHASRVAKIEDELEKARLNVPRALNGEVIPLSPAV